MTSSVVLTHLSFSLLFFLLLPTRALALPLRLAILAAVGALSFVTVDGLTLADYARSYFDELAITTMLWFMWCAQARIRCNSSLCVRHQLQVVLCFAGMALFLYPATLGMSQLDPYRLGFSPAGLFVAMWIVCVFFWWQRNYLALSLVSLATAAYLLDVKHSDNYWDYLIDPVLGIYSIAVLLNRGSQFLWARVPFPSLRSLRKYVPVAAKS
ncbi:hypothetical protein ACXYTJ_02430 [Gilvimarinus sp. F26214L]|uniref:hypothetical protein n=1 Tax=Gilvimarinus sp. DZF01 TaxID=3461371 RepID=UPI0040460CC7